MRLKRARWTSSPRIRLRTPARPDCRIRRVRRVRDERSAPLRARQRVERRSGAQPNASRGRDAAPPSLRSKRGKLF